MTETDRNPQASVTGLVIAGSSSGRAFAGHAWVSAGVVWIASLVIYSVTLAPSVTLEQSGALVVAGQYMGVGRVPGYPVWHLLAKVFTSLFWFVHYRGQPNPAWALNFMSAFFGSLSCGLVTFLASTIGSNITARSTSRGTTVKAHAAAVAAGILFAVGNVMWSQSVITETHTLTLFIILVFLAVSMKLLNRPSGGTACVLALIFGIGISQSEILVLLIPSFLLVLALVNRALCRDFAVTMAAVCALGGLLLRQSTVVSWVAVSSTFGIVLIMSLSARFMPQGRVAVCMVALVLVGLSFYAYLPLAGEGNPPMYFAYPRTWGTFKHCISRGQYEKIVPANILQDPLLFARQLQWFLGILNQQFLFPLAWCALIPFVRLSRFKGTWLGSLLVLVLAFFMFSAVLIVGMNPKMDIQDTFIQRTRLIPAFALWAVFVGLGLTTCLGWLERAADGDQVEPTQK